MPRQNVLLNYFRPSLYVRSIKDINLSQLRRQGIKLFIADLDNTLVPHYTRLPSPEVVDLIQRVSAAGMTFIIMSNNVSSRVQTFARKARVPAYAASHKPLLMTARRIMRDFAVLPSEVVIVGDQIVFDVLVANRMKWESILVQPLVSTDYRMRWGNLVLESFIYKRLERQNILHRGEFIENLPGPELELL